MLVAIQNMSAGTWPRGTLLLIASATSVTAHAGGTADRVTFSPAPGVEASLTVSVPQVLLKIKSKQGGSQETIALETEKSLTIRVEDYNFDGHKDFAISHIDDGMGTYQISHVYVYVYSAQAEKFLPLTPKCGDEFINLAINKAKRTLTSSYVLENTYKTCRMKF